MASPETEARQHVIAIINAEFAEEGFRAEDDKLHESLGSKGTRIGVYVEEARSAAANRLVNEIDVRVQFFGKYDKQIDPNQKVSPSKIEGFADRFRRATKAADPNTASVWYFVLERIQYPDDPTGNKTRFVATLRGRGNNTALMETG